MLQRLLVVSILYYITYMDIQQTKTIMHVILTTQNFKEQMVPIATEDGLLCAFVVFSMMVSDVKFML